ncbi:pirin family protein [Oceanisphaera psychrotolerans]|uniref:Quercetin 2,3-dioxygenase n=1 Tax=Oceanisphaera psychrotolerans TaxID=1414654 RepID=A0A1J4QEN0_9GAMM|nr:pirin family protein [Oceanisphaera psychrotolerans]OIN08954.1 quercetin 2,3-dioxygenase [Oceanisphaera psychrotolerans]
MSNIRWSSGFGSSRECPQQNGRRQIQRLAARTADVGGIPVARLIPGQQRRVIGAWCFLDHAGPAHFTAGDQGLRVGPHPHIGLQTFTWMLQGKVLHRDSLGNEQLIRPGQVNLMTAGHGISHTEESVPGESDLHAAQLWIALPMADKDTPPRFDHYPKLPHWSRDGMDFTLLVGEYQEHKAPVLTFSPLVGIDMYASRNVTVGLTLQKDFEYGLLVLEGSMEAQGDSFTVNELAYLGLHRSEMTITLAPGSRVLLVGGEPLNEEIFVWWNFVGHDKQDIVQALADWNDNSGRFGEVRGYDGTPLQAPRLP